MDFKKEFVRLVNEVKNKAAESGNKLKNEDIAKTLGISRTYLSDLLGTSSEKEVTEKHVLMVREKFKRYLAPDAPFEKDDPLNWERAAIKALTWGLANALSEISELKGKRQDPDSFREEIERSTNLILSDLRRSGKDKVQ